MIPTMTASIEPHTRITVTEDEPVPVLEEKYVDLERGECCAPPPLQLDYDPERVLKALAMAFVFGGLVATTLCFAFSGPSLSEC